MDQIMSGRTITKLEAARRQLQQAIRLFFMRGDAVAVHTLAAAAYQILSDLCEKRGITRQIEDSAILDQLGYKQEVLRAIRAPQNFFKHANVDPESAVHFNPDLSLGMLMLATDMYCALTKQTMPEGQVLRSWFFLKYPQTVPADMRDRFSSVTPMPDLDDFPFFLELMERVSVDADG